MTPLLALTVDPWILAFSAVTVIATIWMGFRSAKTSKTASDFFVAGRSVGVGMNASAISGEYLSAASFMGVAGMVMSSGYDALWYPVCYACGYLFLLLFIAGPLRRFGAYTIPDFAEGRFDSPVFRKIAVVFVLFIGFFYTMPQMKGAGTTLSYIFQGLDFRDTAFSFLAPHGAAGEALPGLNYAIGMLVVGAVITLNVALGGMKGITLVQAFQYWAKMFAISVPVFVLMAVYGDYGKQVGVNGAAEKPNIVELLEANETLRDQIRPVNDAYSAMSLRGMIQKIRDALSSRPKVTQPPWRTLLPPGTTNVTVAQIQGPLLLYASASGRTLLWQTNLNELPRFQMDVTHSSSTTDGEFAALIRKGMESNGAAFFDGPHQTVFVLKSDAAKKMVERSQATASRAPAVVLLSAFKAAGLPEPDWVDEWNRSLGDIKEKFTDVLSGVEVVPASGTVASAMRDMLVHFAERERKMVLVESSITNVWTATTLRISYGTNAGDFARQLGLTLTTNGVQLLPVGKAFVATPTNRVREVQQLINEQGLPGLISGGSVALKRQPLPAKAPPDETWLNPFGPLTTKAAKAAAAALTNRPAKVPGGAGELPGGSGGVPGRPGQVRNGSGEVLRDAEPLPNSAAPPPNRPAPLLNAAAPTPNDGIPSPKAPAPVPGAGKSTTYSDSTPAEAISVQKAWLAEHEKPLALLYTYSLIIAIVCGTAGLPHILVRFYTNPDGVAAKRTTMWVMILIGVFYLFPPVFGVMGRNLLPELYNGLGAKGTDKVVLELPRIISERYGVLGSILSGITCAGAFAAFMSTFSGLLVSMTGALAHDVYGRMLRPQASPAQRMKMFKWCAVIVGGVAILLGARVEKLEINFMVGQAFAIAAASYFPLLFMSIWWRKLTMKGAATGMLTGGLLALVGISLTSFTTLGLLKWDGFWAAHPLLRILCEQPAIWAVPLAITLMFIVSKLTAREVPADIRMKMLVLHAPEDLGLKQEYIQEHQPGH